MRPIRSISILLLLAAFLAGCAGPTPIALYLGEKPDQPGEKRLASELVTVWVPQALEINSINGKAVKAANSQLAHQERALALLPGQYKIEAFYSKIFDVGADAQEAVRSSPVLFVFEASAGQSVRLDFERPGSLGAARRFNTEFSGSAVNLNTGASTATMPVDDAGTQGLVQALIGKLTGTPAVATQTDPQKVAPLPIQGQMTGEAVSPASSAGASSDYMLLVKAFWKQASAAERREFLKWVAEQP